MLHDDRTCNCEEMVRRLEELVSKKDRTPAENEEMRNLSDILIDNTVCV